jgi:DNA-binding XRE family transcriptional regulator
LETAELLSRTELRRKIGQDLRRARLRAGVSIPEAAKAIGVTRMAIYSWEKGSRVPSADTYLMLIRLYEPDDDPPLDEIGQD